MENLKLDLGIRSYRLGSGVLRFNPADPNVYQRFLQAAKNIAALEQELTASGETSGEALIALLSRLDGQIKQELTAVFGGDNDLESCLAGVNVLAVGSNGERIITNLFAALEPVLTEGARLCADTAAAQALKNRQERRG